MNNKAELHNLLNSEGEAKTDKSILDGIFSPSFFETPTVEHEKPKKTNSKKKNNGIFKIETKKRHKGDISKKKRPFNLHFDVQNYYNEIELKHTEKKEVSNHSCQEGENIKINKGKWTKEEHDNFIKGYKMLGKRWTMIAEHYVKSRTGTQVTSYARKRSFINHLEKFYENDVLRSTL